MSAICYCRTNVKDFYIRRRQRRSTSKPATDISTWYYYHEFITSQGSLSYPPTTPLWILFKDSKMH